MNSCEVCGKSFKYPYLLLRHLNRVTSCSSDNKIVDKSPEIYEKVSQNYEKVCPIYEKVSQIYEKVTPIYEKVSPIYEKVTHEKDFQCDKCLKVLKTKQNLKNHCKICKGVDTLQCPTCLKVFSSKTAKYKHVRNGKCNAIIVQDKDLKEENEALKKEISILKATRGNTVTNNNNNNFVTNYTIKYQVKYNPETKCLTTDDPEAPFPELLCFNGFKHEAARSQLKDIDKDTLQVQIDNIRNNKDYYAFYSFFFRNVDNRRLHMFNLGKNNNTTHAQVFNNGSLEKIHRSKLFENVSKYIGQYLLNMSIDNADIIYHLTTDQESKNAFIEVTKDKSHTFNYYKDTNENEEL